MKSRIVISFLLLLLSSCALFKKKSAHIEFKNCPENSSELLSSAAETAMSDTIRCLRDHGRVEDAIKLQQIEKSNLKIRCELNESAFYVMADTGAGYNINFEKLPSDPKAEKLKSELFHESIHLLGYPHASGYDLSNIADFCCRDHGDKKLNALGQKSCSLFRFQNSDWLTPEYIREFSASASTFGKKGIVLRTTLNAAMSLNKKGKVDRVFPVLVAPLAELNREALKNKFGRRDKKKLSNEIQIPQALILSQLGFKASDEKTIRFSRELNAKLVSRFYPYPIDKEKLAYFTNVSELLWSIFKGDSVNLQKSWLDYKNRSEYLCRDLQKNEIMAISEIMNAINVSLFEFKNKISAGEFYEMATYWSNPCELHKSLKPNSLNSDEKH